MKRDFSRLSVLLVVSTIISSSAFAETTVYRSRSGGSENSHPKVIRSVEDAKLYKESDLDEKQDMRARPIYEELNDEPSGTEPSGTEQVTKKKVYVSRNGSAMARPKIIIQK